MMTDHSLTVGLFVMVTFFATMVQTLAGFAFALIMMPIVTMILGVRTAAPLVALTALTLYGVNSIRYHASPNLGGDLAAGGNIRGRGFTRHLGGCECQRSFRQSADRLDSFSYGLYGLTRPSSLQPCSPRWAYLAGFLSGSLGGAYNTLGPPLAVYGTLRQWPKDEFRAGLQSLFFVSGALTVLSHAFANHLTSTVFGSMPGLPPHFSYAFWRVYGWIATWTRTDFAFLSW